MKILIYAEDKPLAGFIARGLSGEGFATLIASSQGDFENCLRSERVELAIAECNSPHMIERIPKLREPICNVIALTASASVESRLKLLEAGADDCLTKPFAFAELLARVKALVRRRQASGAHEIRYRDLELNRITRSVVRDGKRIELTPKEFSLLEYLLLNIGKTVSRSMILEDVWRVHFDTMTNVVDVYVNYLRRKVDCGASERLIKTVRGSGYCIGS